MFEYGFFWSVETVVGFRHGNTVWKTLIFQIQITKTQGLAL